MLAKLRIRLEADSSEVGYYQSSNFQGILMEQIDHNYAEVLHKQGLKPYSQYILGREEKEWIVTTLTKEAYHEIITPLLDEKFTEFTINKKDMHIKILSKDLKKTDKQELLDEFYSNECDKYLNLEFLTPASFKSNGRYVIMPDMRYIYQSLMNKYSASSGDMEMYDDETLEQLVNSSHIIRYKLKSTIFPLEGIKVPSFKGEIGIKITGTDTMARYARLLARFGEYSGVGIKTAIGMGALRIKERG